MTPSDSLHTPRRFRRHIQPVPDLLGDQVEDIAVEQLCLSLLFDFEDRTGYSCIPIIRLQRKHSDSFVLDKHYIPPTLTIACSPVLMDITEHICDIVYAKHLRLSEQRHQRTRQAADFRVSDTPLFWLLYCVNQAWPELYHLKHYPEQHPQQLYLALAKLAVGLNLFSLEYGLSALPAYNHAHPEKVFPALEHLIRQLLDTVIPTAMVVIELTRSSPTHWQAHLHDPCLDETTDFYLLVRSALPRDQLRQQFPRICKAGTPDEVARIVSSALNGIPLIPVQQLPIALPIRIENQYFTLDKQHASFKHMLAARSCGFYVSTSLPDIQLEFYALTQS